MFLLFTFSESHLGWSEPVSRSVRALHHSIQLYLLCIYNRRNWNCVKFIVKVIIVFCLIYRHSRKKNNFNKRKKNSKQCGNNKIFKQKEDNKVCVVKNWYYLYGQRTKLKLKFVTKNNSRGICETIAKYSTKLKNKCKHF